MARISVTKQFEKKVKSSHDNYFQKLEIKVKVENQIEQKANETKDLNIPFIISEQLSLNSSPKTIIC